MLTVESKVGIQVPTEKLLFLYIWKFSWKPVEGKNVVTSGEAREEMWVDERRPYFIRYAF